MKPGQEPGRAGVAGFRTISLVDLTDKFHAKFTLWRVID